jgi:hypothetical protein
MLEAIVDRASTRKVRLLTCACCRLVWEYLVDDRSRDAVLAAEQEADGTTPEVALSAARAEAKAAYNTLVRQRLGAYYSDYALAAVCIASESVRHALGWLACRHWRLVGAQAVVLLRDVIGNPFQVVVVDPSHRTSTAVAIAQGMYESRDFSAMPSLADALQDAGCDNEDILNHCHDVSLTLVRGCWVVDLVLGNE